MDMKKTISGVIKNRKGQCEEGRTMARVEMRRGRDKTSHAQLAAIRAAKVSLDTAQITP